NTGSLYLGDLGPEGLTTFVSEGYILNQLSKESGLALGPKGIDGKSDARSMHDRQLRANSMLIIDLETLQRTLLTFEVALAEAVSAPVYAPNLGSMRAIEDKSLLDAEYRARMRRCTKCLLPETMPFISY